jgi:hypothetical protein
MSAFPQVLVLKLPQSSLDAGPVGRVIVTGAFEVLVDEVCGNAMRFPLCCSLVHRRLLGLGLAGGRRQ